MNHENATTGPPIVCKLSGEIIIEAAHLELLLKRVLIEAAPKQTVAPVQVPACPQVQPLKSRLMFTVKETAEALGISEKTVYRLVQRNLLRTSRALRHIRIPKSEIERFLTATAD
jgi:excisionase family DNA binding protein